MQIKTFQFTSLDAAAVARDNRSRLRGYGVFTANIIGPAGCGKTSLLQTTLKNLHFGTRVGVITADPASHTDPDRLAGFAHQFARVDADGTCCLNPIEFSAALDELDLCELDLLLVENVSSSTGAPCRDLGETMRVAVVSVAAGDDQLKNNRGAVRWADVVVLNKTDLLPSVPCDLAAFRRMVRRVNPSATLFELSARTGEGVGAWLSRLEREASRLNEQGTRP
jgi:hydrogenase nickel incorporation protein HypB